MDNTTPNFETALQTFVTSAQAIIDDHMTKNFPMLPREVLTVEPGRRYVRIVKSHGESGRYVYCFVDKTNGDILKAATWKAPAKHARGNIYTTKDISQAVNHYGAHYMSR
jgi:hypothetical protein